MSDGSSARLPEEPRALAAWLSSMNDRTRALLEFHFDRDERRSFVLAASAVSADVVIVDYDYPGTRAAFEGGAWRDGPPLMLLAHGAPALDGALVLAKPLDRSSLDVAAARLRGAEPGTRPSGSIGAGANRSGDAPLAFASAAAVPPEPSVQPSVQPSFAPSSGLPSESSSAPPMLALASGHRHASRPDPATAAVAPLDERALARVNALCGPPRSMIDLAATVDSVHRYDPTRHLGGHLAAAMDGLTAAGSDVRGLRLTFPDIELYVLPWLDRICVSEPLTWQVGVDRAFRAFDDADVTLVPYRSGTVNALVARVNAGACQAFPIAAFRWLAALFSARGRLPHGVDVETPLVMAHWPNLTRLEMTPACLSIVAEWTSRPCSIAAMVERVGCEPRHVTSLYAAASECGLLRRATSATDPYMEDGDDDGTT